MDLTNLITNKSKVLNIVFIMVALIIAININKNQNQTLKALNEKKALGIKKNAVLVNISKLEKDADTYKNLLNKEDISLAINTISNIAKESGIKIISIKPEKERGYLGYIKYPFALSMEAESYHAIGKFISRLENHADIYILESAVMKQGVAKSQEAVLTGNKLIGDLRLSTVLFKD